MQPAPASAIGSPKTKALKQSQGGPARCWLITPFQRLAIFALGLQCRFQAHHLRSLQLSNLKRWCDGIGAGFRRFWRWKSNSRGGRPRIEIELRALIRQMSTENQLWGAPRIHGELLKLGFSVAQSTVAKYMVKRRGPASQGWRTFLRNHAPDIAAMDPFVVPTIGFKLLYGFVNVRIDRRDLVWINVTTTPTAE